MFVNYATLALRTMRRQKIYSFINIAGLALGMACSILILLWVQDELSYDRFHQHASALFRVEEDQYYSGQVFHTAATPFLAANAFVQEIPEVLEASRYSWGFTALLRHGDQAFFESNGRGVDPSFLRMFSFPFIAGNADNALDQPDAIVLSATLAEKYFGSGNPLGKVLVVNNRHNLQVTGVFADLPQNSSLRFNFLVNVDFENKAIGRYSENWQSNSIQTYVRVQPGSDVAALPEKLTAILRKNEVQTTEFTLMPLTDLHLHAYGGYGRPAGNIQYVYIFAVIAFFVLFIACINFMNLATARSANRAREIGMRKVAGAVRINLIRQFIGESIIMAFLALLLALILVQAVLPLFNSLAGKEISSGVLLSPLAIGGLLALTVITGFIAGSYPAFFLSAFQPVRVLRGTLAVGSKSSGLRRALVVLQFTLSVFLIIGTLVVYQQLHFMRNKSVGYDRAHTLYISMRGDLNKQFETLKHRLQQHPAILGVSGSRDLPSSIGSNSSGVNWEGKDPELRKLIDYTFVDVDFVQTLDLKLASGRGFSRQFATDMATDSTAAFLVNQEFEKLMGVESALGRQITFLGAKGPIIGVLENYHHRSVRTSIEPLAMIAAPQTYLRFLLIRVAPGQVATALDHVEETWRETATGYPFEYRFVDEDFERMFRAEARMGGLLQYFAILAIFISCLGLLGLAAFTAQQRTSEIGVRKVLGASIAHIVLLLSREFARWVMLATVIAWLLAYFIMNNWLQNFPYRIEIGWQTYLLAGTLALLIAGVTVSTQALKAAMINPVRALRNE